MKTKVNEVLNSKKYEGTDVAVIVACMFLGVIIVCSYVILKVVSFIKRKKNISEFHNDIDNALDEIIIEGLISQMN